MTEKTEQISALMDGDLDDAAIDALLESGEMLQAWEEYHLVRDTIQGELCDAGVDFSFADRVAEAIEREPTVMAPQTARRPGKADNPLGKVVPLFRKMGQYAIAATVAAVTVVGVQQYGGATQDEVLQSPVSTRVTGNLVPVSVSANTPTYTAPATVSQQSSRQEQIRLQAQMKAHNQRINAYLQDHQFQLRTYQPQSSINEDEQKAEETNNP